MGRIDVVLGLWLAITSTITAAAEPPSFRITCKRSEDRVEVKSDKGRVTFSIRSPSGISQAIIERTVDRWPEEVVIQLRLKGLESLKVSDGDVELCASVSSQDGKVRLWRSGEENSPLDSKSPYWTEIRVRERDGKQTDSIPRIDGYIDVPLPRALLEGDPKTITLQWIDFYRN